MSVSSQRQRETELWLLDGERYPHGWVMGEFERRRYPSAAQAVEAFREKYPDLTSVRYHNTGDLLWSGKVQRELGFYWVRFKRAGNLEGQHVYGDDPWPWLENDLRRVALYNPDGGSMRWYCLGQFRAESEFEEIGARLPDFDGNSREYQRGWLDAMMKVREFEDREVGRVVANWLAETNVRGFD